LLQDKAILREVGKWVISWCGDCDDLVSASEGQAECGRGPFWGTSWIKFDKGYEDGETRIVLYT